MIYQPSCLYSLAILSLAISPCLWRRNTYTSRHSWHAKCSEALRHSMWQIRQNADSMTLAVRELLRELFQATKREAEVHRQILAVSVSHNRSTVRIWSRSLSGNRGERYEHHRHPIYNFAVTALRGKENCGSIHEECVRCVDAVSFRGDMLSHSLVATRLRLR